MAAWRNKAGQNSGTGRRLPGAVRSGRVRREGKDVTIITWTSTVYLALELAHQMEADGRSLEIIDVRSTDEELIYAGVRKINRVMRPTIVGSGGATMTFTTEARHMGA